MEKDDRTVQQEHTEYGVFFKKSGGGRKGAENDPLGYGQFISLSPEEAVPVVDQAEAVESPAARRPKKAKPGKKKRKMGPGRRPGRVVFPIGIKLSGIITVVLFVSLGLITFLVWFFIHGSQERTAIANNISINDSAAMVTESALDSVFAGVSVLGYNLSSGSSFGLSPGLLTEPFFKAHKNIGAVSFGAGSLFINEDFFVDHELDSLQAAAYLETLNRESGETGIFNAAPFFSGAPVLLMRFVSPAGEEEEEAVRVLLELLEEPLAGE
jgi:hypothetical protein